MGCERRRFDMAKVTIADLSERISIIGFITKRNERGDVINLVEFERCRIWAKVYALTAKNVDATPEDTNKISYRVTIRHRDDIKPDDEIVWRERRLKIVSPPYDLGGRREFTAMDCEEVVSDGAA